VKLSMQYQFNGLLYILGVGSGIPFISLLSWILILVCLYWVVIYYFYLINFSFWS